MSAEQPRGKGSGEAFQVLARRYRPQVFTEVVGQDAIVRTLTNALGGGRIAHAYLFHGTRGVGKTTMARLLAKALNCEKGPTTEPCNTCDSCREIAAGSAVDVLEIDGASHNRVDDVRELQESLTYQPVRDRNRVIIIDEVHMLSRSAFNALLKTLEEPPAHVVFVLATTELEKIPATILSRCQHFTFRRIRRPELQRYLSRIAEQEGLKLSAASLGLLARQAAGSLRDALSALDQVVSFCGEAASDEDVAAVLGGLPANRVDELLARVAAADAAGALSTLRVSEDRGDDPARFAEALLARLRDLSVLCAAGRETDLVEADDDERRDLAELADKLGEDALVRLFQMAAQLEPALRHSRQPRLLLELTALKMLKAADLTPLAELAARLSTAGSGAQPAGPGSGGLAPRRPSAAPARPAAPARGRRAAPAAPEGPPAQPEPASLRDIPAPVAALPGGQGTAAGPGEAVDLAALRRALEGTRPAVAAFLEHADGAMAGRSLYLTFQPRHSFFKKSVEIPANLEALQNAARQVLGAGVSVELALAERNRPTPEPSRESDVDRRRRLMQEAQGQPAVQTMRNVFGAEITSIHPVEPADDSGGQEAET